MKNANLNPCEIAIFLNFSKMFPRENIYVHSTGTTSARSVDRFLNKSVKFASLPLYKLRYACVYRCEVWRYGGGQDR